MNLKQSIRRILREENEGHKVKLVKRMIHSLYDEVSFIEQSTYNNKPLLKIYFDSDDTAANIESWFDEKISRDIDEYTSGNIVVCPSWIFEWDWRKKNADVFIETELLKYDNLGNVVNESVLREETVSTSVRRRIHAIDWQIDFAVREVNRQYTNICNMGESGFIETVTEKTIESMYWDFFSDMDDNSNEWTAAYHFMVRYINNNFVDKLKQNYHMNCGD